MTAVIEASGVSKSYGAILGIEDLNLTVDRGEIFGFLGPNGAGKTTSIRLLMQLLRPDRGHISVLGATLKDRSARLQERIGYLPGEFRPYPELKGGQFLEYMARYRSSPPKLRNSLCEQLEFSRKELEQPVKHLSHGNRQKLGLLLALEHEPDLAILDEPTLGLDPLVQESFYDVLRGLRDRGTTIFLSSHLLAEVEKVCNRVAIVRKGRLVALESIELLKRRQPRQLIVVLASDDTDTPVLPEARLISRDGRRCVYALAGDVHRLLQELALLPGLDVFLPEPKLDDVFMAYYRSGGA